MKTSIVAGSALAASIAALVLTAPLHAQLVSADVVVRSGPVRGHVVVGDGYSSYRHRPVVVYERPARVVVVERFRRHDHRHWKRHGYRQVKVYYVDGRYFDRYDRRRPGMREIIVYERDGRYYRDDRDRRDRRDDRDDYRDRHRDRDRDHHRDYHRDRWDD